MSTTTALLPMARLRNDYLKYGSLALFAGSLILTAVHGVLRSAEQFSYAHAFVSADTATTARTFLREGVIALRGVPVNNNPPISSIDFYAHWPPLMTVLLSGCFRVFGPSNET